MTMENESSISLGWGQNFQTPTAVKKTGPASSFTWKIGWGGGKISVWSLIYSIVRYVKKTQIKPMEMSI